RDDAHCRAPVRAEDSVKLGQSADRIRKEHQSQVAQNTVEAISGERQSLTVHGGHSKSVIGEPRARRLQHVARNVDADHHPRPTESAAGGGGGLARPYRDVENALAARDLRRRQDGRYEQTGPATEVLLVRGDVHPLARGSVETWSEADFRP